MSVLMPVPMMEIGKVRMLVHEWTVPMPMAVWFAWRVARPVIMLMVCVVHMPVLVVHGFVQVLVLMTFSQVYPQTNRHEAACHHQPDCQQLIEQCQR